MRWSRLLLGREFELTEESLLRIWIISLFIYLFVYIFVCVLDAYMVTLTTDKQNISHFHTSLKKHHSSQKYLKSDSSSNLSSLNDTFDSNPNSNSTLKIINKQSITPKSINLIPVPLDPLSGAFYPKQEIENEDSSEDERRKHTSYSK